MDTPGCGRYSTNKAGMDGLDKQTIMQIILENSKGSKFYENELRRERLLHQQIEAKLRQIRSLTPVMIQNAEHEASVLFLIPVHTTCLIQPEVRYMCPAS
ncbi:hypothetical protein P879_06913 [Paragonimus westermani]|uniref:Uncharacterized protein n=1 Tax=Paragonimus westermani TaxID=34504 RepID=A0A8T0DTT5_9TREM|nr:hypothetical protein P879_06913 [Paragonimus westermani]